MTAETDDPPAVFTERDRELLSEIHGILVKIEPYLPMLERARAWLDRNPAAWWKQKHGGMRGVPHAVPQDREG